MHLSSGTTASKRTHMHRSSSGSAPSIAVLLTCSLSHALGEERVDQVHHHAQRPLHGGGGGVRGAQLRQARVELVQNGPHVRAQQRVLRVLGWG